jgi:hypothetical protein
MKKINAEQIDALYAFTIKHYIEYYDLQTELVDHLANAIEQRWVTDPNVPFEEALHHEFKKFGIFGFTELAERREHVLSKKYNSLLWEYGKSFLKVPKILLTLALFSVVIFLFNKNEIWMSILPFFALLVFAVRVIQLLWRYKKKVRATGKKWLFEHVIFNFAGMGAPTILPFQLVNFYFEYHAPAILVWINAAYFTGMILYYYIMFYVVPSRSEEHLLNTYPEYAFENIAQKV